MQCLRPFLAGWLLVTIVSYAAADAPEPPVAKKMPHKLVAHGKVRIDNYYWLRERDNPEVIGYLKAENAYTEAMTEHTKALQQKLYDEIKGRIKQNDQSVPYRHGDYWYYSRTVEGKQYRVYCRKHETLDAPEQVLLDVNKLAEGHDYYSLGAFAVSPNHKLLAYAYDTNGSEKYTLVVKNLATGAMLDDHVPNTSASVEWANDNATLFYTTQDEAHRPFKVFRHKLGAKPADDELIYHEKDERFFVDLGKTRSEKYILIVLGSSITNEVRFLDADQPNDAFRLLAPRRQGVEYSVSHHGDDFIITTNLDAVNFKVVRAPVDHPGWDNWRDLIVHRPQVKVDDVDVFKDYLVVYERADGLKKIRVQDFATGKWHYIAFDEPVYTTFASTNMVYDTHTLRFSYMSLVTPRSVYDYDMAKRTRTLLKRDEVLGGYDPDNYESHRIWATALDGTKVPMSIVYRKGLTLNGDNPTLLYGYGSYGISMDPTFSYSRISLLDRGFVYALAHIRGGGEMGRMWYENGKFLHKKNTFTDFIACAEKLIADKYTRPERLAIQGGSAGGLLIGAVLNMRPDLFKVAVAQVPFVDVVTTMLDPSIPLTVTEYEEWGNPNDEKFYDYMVSYSPYDNVKAQDYPNILITAGLNDPRVQYWEPAKWCAKLREMKTDHNVLLLKTNMGAGHAGASGRYDRLREIAFNYAFVIDRLGVN